MISSRWWCIPLACLFALQAAAAPAEPHNLIIFVADGLRAGMVSAQTAPTMQAIKQQGVWFQNSHALFPTFTTANAAAIATGHSLGDHGDFSNTIYVDFPVVAAANTPTPFLENDAVLGEVNQHFGGDYLNEESVLAAARKQGLATAAVGKLGPVAIQDVTARDGLGTIIIDDSTGHAGGIALSEDVSAALKAQNLPLAAPGRGANGNAGSMQTPGTLVANVDQQAYFAAVATRVLLPRFQAQKRPFVMVFWSRDPDGSQHNQGDSLGQLVPGINGPTSLRGIHNADDNLAALMGALEALGLDKTTDIIVTADHGFSTISKQSSSSFSAHQHYPDVPPGQVPAGFLAIDLAQALHLPLYDPNAKNNRVEPAMGQHPVAGNGLIGEHVDHPEVVVAANGGSDLIYLPNDDAARLAPRVIDALLAEDYVSGLFVADQLGQLAGTLPLSKINLLGSALTPTPAIVVNFRSESSGCRDATVCAVEVADTGLQQGQGMHGSFSRADTDNFMAAIGPDFKSGYIDHAPVSNADVARTAAQLLHLAVPAHGTLIGRNASEALRGGAAVHWQASIVRSAPAANGLETVLDLQTLGANTYFDAAGFAHRSVGLAP